MTIRGGPASEPRGRWRGQCRCWTQHCPGHLENLVEGTREIDLRNFDIVDALKRLHNDGGNVLANVCDPSAQSDSRSVADDDGVDPLSAVEFLAQSWAAVRVE